MTINFKTRSDKKANLVRVWCRVRNGKAVDVSIPMDLYVLPSRWDDKKGRPRAFNKTTAPDLHKWAEDTNKLLDGVRDDIIEYSDACDAKGAYMDRGGIERIVNKKREETKDIPRDPVGYCSYLIEQMKSGAFHYGSETYSPATIKVWVVFRNVLKKFEESYGVFTWRDIDKRLADAFVGYLNGHGYMLKTANKLIITFKALIRYAAKYDHLHDNLAAIDCFCKRRETAGCTSAMIYLTEDELQSLYEMQLEPGSLRDQVRDVFLVGAWTGQRVGDYAHLSASNFGVTDRGTHVVRLVQSKTGNEVCVPILNENLQSIVEKYNGNIPNVDDIIINRYIKLILKDLSESVPSLKTMVKTQLTLHERNAEKDGKKAYERDDEGNVLKPRYDCCSTHTARRSCITNLYKSGIYTTRQMMSISGHSTEKIFFEYVKLSSDELADEISRIQEDAKKKVSSNAELF